MKKKVKIMLMLGWSQSEVLLNFMQGQINLNFSVSDQMWMLPLYMGSTSLKVNTRQDFGSRYDQQLTY